MQIHSKPVIEAPSLIDYTTDDSDDVTDIDCMRYFHDRDLYDIQQTQLNQLNGNNISIKRKLPFRTRKQKRKRDVTRTFWYESYVIDKYGTFSDPQHSDSKLFSLRFSHSFASVKSIVEKIQEPEHYFWKQTKDGRGNYTLC